MLIADIKIVPFGDWNDVRHIKRLNIVNQGIVEPDTDLCQYACWFSPEPEDEFIRVPEVGTSGVHRVYFFNHSRSDGAEECALRALSCF